MQVDKMIMTILSLNTAAWLLLSMLAGWAGVQSAAAIMFMFAALNGFSAFGFSFLIREWRDL